MLSWLARSSLSLGTRLGTDAEVAGAQNWVVMPARNLATKIQVRFGKMGMDRNSRPRIRSPTIIVVRRSNRSATAPASGPNSSAGSSVASQTPPTAELLATAPPEVSEGASAVSATMLSQSPRLDRDNALHSARNGLMDSTPSPERFRLARWAGGPFPGRSLRGVARKFTA